MSQINDSKGRPCKERLATDLAAKHVNEVKEGITGGAVEKDIESISQLKSWFASSELTDFLDHSSIGLDE